MTHNAPKKAYLEGDANVNVFRKVARSVIRHAQNELLLKIEVGILLRLWVVHFWKNNTTVEANFAQNSIKRT